MKRVVSTSYLTFYKLKDIKLTFYNFKGSLFFMHILHFSKYKFSNSIRIVSELRLKGQILFHKYRIVPKEKSVCLHMILCVPSCLMPFSLKFGDKFQIIWRKVFKIVLLLPIHISKWVLPKVYFNLE